MALAVAPNCCHHDRHTPNHHGCGVGTVGFAVAADTAADKPAFCFEAPASGFGTPAIQGSAAKRAAGVALENALCHLGKFLLALMGQQGSLGLAQ